VAVVMKKIKLKLDQAEFEIIINGLVEFKNKLIREKEDTALVDDLLLKLLKDKSK
jgi:hypothetical protein